MHWASFDPFLIDDPFWQSRMGMPVANREFLQALLHRTGFASYRFFAADSVLAERLRHALQDLAGPGRGRVQVVPQALALESMRRCSVDVMHNGDCTHFMPYLIEWRNRLDRMAPFPITGVTHSLDTVSLYPKFLQLLLAHPKPYDAVICTSECALRMLHRTFMEIRLRFKEAFSARLPAPPRLVKIPLGIGDDRFQGPDKAQARAQLGFSHQVVMLCLARLSPRKKMDLAPFLEALAWLQQQGRTGEWPNDWVLVLAGAGKKSDIALVHDMITRLGLSRRVRLETNVSDQRKQLLYAAADLFCSLSDNYQETFGLTLIEAMARGLPVIASDFDGYKELVVHGETGFLVPTYASVCQEPWDGLSGLLEPSMLRFYRAQKVAFDMDALLDHLRTLLLDADLRRSMGAAARRRADGYRWGRILRDYETLWRELRQEADRAPLSPRPSNEDLPPLLTPRVSGIFGHYPSAFLTLDSVVGLSDYARLQPVSGPEPILYQEVALLVGGEVLDFVRGRLQENDSTVGAIASEMRNRFGLDTNAAFFHLDWLLKHGFLKLKKI